MLLPLACVMASDAKRPKVEESDAHECGYAVQQCDGHDPFVHDPIVIEELHFGEFPWRRVIVGCADLSSWWLARWSTN